MLKDKIQSNKVLAESNKNRFKTFKVVSGEITIFATHKKTRFLLKCF